MIGVVSQIAFTLGDRNEDFWRTRSGTSILVTDCALQRDTQIFVVRCPPQRHVETIIGLFINEPIRCDVSPKHVGLHPRAAQRHWILIDIKDGFAVIGPDEIGFGISDGVNA